jgi:hypothetical protein
MNNKQVIYILIGAVAFYFLFIKKWKIEREFQNATPSEDQRKILYGK